VVVEQFGRGTYYLNIIVYRFFLHAIHTGSNSIIKITEPHTAQARVQQGEGAPQKLAFEREQSNFTVGVLSKESNQQKDPELTMPTGPRNRPHQLNETTTKSANQANLQHQQRSPLGTINIRIVIHFTSIANAPNVLPDRS
jgi:hypothetical protein